MYPTSGTSHLQTAFLHPRYCARCDVTTRKAHMLTLQAERAGGRD